jgi:hypothetical protein
MQDGLGKEVSQHNKGFSGVGECSQHKAHHGLSSMVITENRGFANGGNPI